MSNGNGYQSLDRDHPPPTPVTPPPPPTPTTNGFAGQCFLGGGRPGNCVSSCQGLFPHGLATICPNTLCAVTGSNKLYSSTNCQQVQGYYPQYPAPAAPASALNPSPPTTPPQPTGGSNGNLPFPESPPALSCPEGFSLECADVSGDQIIPSQLPILDDDGPFTVPSMAAAVPQLMTVAVQGLDQLTAAIKDGFNALLADAASHQIQTTLPIEGDLGRQLDAVAATVAKIDAKLTGKLGDTFGEAAAYAGQLGILPPSHDQLMAQSAGTPADPTGNKFGGFGDVPADVMARPDLLPLLPDSLGSNNTLGYAPTIIQGTQPGTSCGVIAKDVNGDGKATWFQIPGTDANGRPVSVCPNLGGTLLNNPPPLPTNCPTGVNPDGSCKLDAGLPTPTPPNPPTTDPIIGCSIIDQTHANLLFQSGHTQIVETPDAVAYCLGNNNNNNPPGGGNVLNPNPAGNLNNVPGGGNCPPVIVNPTPCQTVQPGGNVVNNIIPPNPGGNIIINNPPPAGTGTLNNTPGGTIVVQPATEPAPNVIVNVPPPPPPPPPVPGDLSAGRQGDAFHNADNWNTLNACKFVNLNTIVRLVQGDHLAQVLGWETPDGKHAAPGDLAEDLNALPFRIGDLISDAVRWLLYGVENVAAAVPGSTGCTPEAAVLPIINNMLMGIVNALTGGSLAAFRVPFQQQLNSLCPQQIPSPGECDAALLAGTITDSQWRCWVNANGVADIPHRQVLEAQRTRASLADVFQLWMRGKLTDAELNQQLIKRGVLHPEEGEQLKTLTQHVPGIRDVIDLMAGQRNDDDQASFNGWDANFEDRYDGQLKQWLTANGVSEDQAKLLWRQHWTMPDNSDLIEMLFRLRPGADNPAGSVTEDDIRHALQNNGLSPEWISRVIAVRRPQITLRELRNLVVHANYDEAKLAGAFQNMGYTETQATDLAKGYYGSFLKAKLQEQGVPTVAEITKLYMDDSMSKDVATNLLKQYGYDDEAVKQIFDTADAQLNSKMRAENVKAVRVRYMKGEYRDDEAITQLMQAGLTADRASQRVNYWGVERNLDYRLPSTQQLCSAFTDGFIDLATYQRRMQNLGYSLDDMRALVGRCVVADTDKRTKEIQKQLKEQQAAMEKRAKAEQAAAKAAAKLRSQQFPCKAPAKPTCPPGVVPPLQA